jgi:hypothetical protein
MILILSYKEEVLAIGNGRPVFFVLLKYDCGTQQPCNLICQSDQPNRFPLFSILTTDDFLTEERMASTSQAAPFNLFLPPTQQQQQPQKQNQPSSAPTVAPTAEPTNSSAASSLNPSGIVPTLQNIVATVNLDCKLDLKTIALHSRNAEYNPKVLVEYCSLTISGLLPLL